MEIRGIIRQIVNIPAPKLCLALLTNRTGNSGGLYTGENRNIILCVKFLLPRFLVLELFT
jgi:hypothetical protein